MQQRLPPVPPNPGFLSPDTYRQIKEGIENGTTSRRGAYLKNSVTEGGTMCRGQFQGVADCPAHQLVIINQLNLNNTSKDVRAYVDQNVVGFTNILPAADVFDYALGITREGCPQLGDFVRLTVSGIATLLVNEVKDLAHRYITVEDPSRTVTTDKPTPIKIIYMAADIAQGEQDAKVKVFLGAGGGGGSGVAIPLKLTKNAGEQGTGTTMPTFEYEVADFFTGNVYYAQEDPTALPHYWVRHIGQMTEATFGWGFTDPSNNDELIITWINEQMIAAICEESTEPPPEGPDGP